MSAVVGKMGEQMAADFLKARGFRIMEVNYRSRFGEIDIIARCGNETHFVEVKTRKSDAYGGPEAAVDRAKQRKIRTAARLFMNDRRSADGLISFDVIAIDLSGSSERVTFYEGAF